jgi:hypothetical protein
LGLIASLLSLQGIFELAVLITPRRAVLTDGSGQLLARFFQVEFIHWFFPAIVDVVLIQTRRRYHVLVESNRFGVFRFDKGDVR